MHRFFSDQSTQRALASLSDAKNLTVFVGAGASAEVGFPTWSQLLAHLSEHLVDGMGDDEAAELRTFIGDAGALTAAERIQRSLPPGDIEDQIRKAFYGTDRPIDFQPGPLTRAVARLKTEFRNTKVVTTNYDQLLLTAVRDLGLDNAMSYCLATRKYDAIIHLHGVLGFEPPDDGDNDVILTEHDFLAPNSSWRWELVKKSLTDSSCLFVGASLTDLNLLLPLHQVDPDDEPRHVVVFVRDHVMTPSVRERAEMIDRSRWEALGVRVVYADNFSDVGQFVDEVRLRRASGAEYTKLPDRIADWRSKSMRFLRPADPDMFRSSQEVLASQLEIVLGDIQDKFGLNEEVMQLGVFALAPTGDESAEHASVVVTSDRVMRDPRSTEPLELIRSTPWTGVRAMITGVPVSESKDHYASRWKYMLATPIRLPAPVDCIIGSVVLSSTSRTSAIRSKGEGTLSPAKYRRLCALLEEAGQIVLAGPQGDGTVTPSE